MEKRRYTKIQIYLPEIKEMIAQGKSQREIAEYYGLSNKTVVKDLLRRERRKDEKAKAGIQLRKPGRQRKDSRSRDIVAEQAYEIKRLKMENELLRDFLRLAGRK